MSFKYILVKLMTVLALLWPAIARATSVTGTPCTSGESWSFEGSSVPLEARLEFTSFLLHRVSTARTFSEALALRSASLYNDSETRVFAEYWIARALLEAKLTHSAYFAFQAISARKPDSRTVRVQLAALRCADLIYRKLPAMEPARGARAQHPKPLANYLANHLADYLALARGSAELQYVREFAESLFYVQLSESASEAELAKTLGVMRGMGDADLFAQAVFASRRNDHTGAISRLEQSEKSIDTAPASVRDRARLLLAREYFAVKQFERGSNQLKRVSKSSNELAAALSELAWHQLTGERYREAIGTALSLEVGGLRNAYAPEAGMVMAMALNEMCQYPDSLMAIQAFRRSYEKPYRWLVDWQSTKSHASLYGLALKYLKKEAVPVPNRLIGEWIRSPVFIASQDEINSLFDESDAAQALGIAASREQSTMAREIRTLAAELKSRVQKEKGAQKTYQPGVAGLSAPTRVRLASLARMLSHYNRFRRAAAIWQTVLAAQEKRTVEIKQRLIARVNNELASSNVRMLTQLQEIAENNQMIEIEIYNGATQDIIWQNAHPDYKTMAKQIVEEQRHAYAEKVWDWGTIRTGGDTDSEVWEDELGSLKAKMFDNCSSKDRYLALKFPGKNKGGT